MLTNPTLLTTMVALFQNTFREAPPSELVILSSKLVRKSSPGTQHTPHLNVLHSSLRFHRILFMKSRKYSCAKKKTA